jgi:hypothetical protein
MKLFKLLKKSKNDTKTKPIVVFIIGILLIFVSLITSPDFPEIFLNISKDLIIPALLLMAYFIIKTIKKRR